MSSESRAHEEGTEQRNGAKPGQHNRAGLSARLGRPTLPAVPFLQKVVQRAKMMGNGPTLAWLPVPGIVWVEGGHVPQASACVCCGSKGISYFSQFIWLIHSVAVFLAPLSLPRSTEDS